MHGHVCSGKQIIKQEIFVSGEKVTEQNSNHCTHTNTTIAAIILHREVSIFINAQCGEGFGP
jgi:hypothetical protein